MTQNRLRTILVCALLAGAISVEPVRGQLIGMYKGTHRQPGEQDLPAGFDASSWLARRQSAATESGDQAGFRQRLQALAERPGTDPMIMVLLAEQYGAANDDRSAVIWLRRAIEELGSEAERYPVNLQYLLGTSLGNLRDLGGAAEALNAAKRHYTVGNEPLEIDGKMASVYALLGQMKQAREAVRAALSQTPADPRPWLLLRGLTLDPKGRNARPAEAADPSTSPTTSNTLDKILALGYASTWEAASVVQNSELYLSFADELSAAKRPKAAQNFRQTAAAVCLLQALRKVRDKDYPTALALFSLADRAVSLASLDAASQMELLPFIVTAHLKQNLAVQALSLIEGFTRASTEMRQRQYAMVLERALASMSWNLETGERLTDDWNSFADLVKGETWFMTELKLRRTEPQLRPPAQLRSLWRKDFRYGMTSPNEDVTTVGTATDVIPALIGQEIDLLLDEGKPELPLKVMLVEIEKLASPLLGMLGGNPKVSNGQIHLPIMNQERLGRLAALMERPGASLRPQVLDAFATARTLLRVLPSLVE